MIFNQIFLVHSTLPAKVFEAAKEAEEFLQGHLGVILDQSKFTHTDDAPETVFNHIASVVYEFYQNSPNQIWKPRVIVEPWKPMNPWTSAIATTFKNRPGVVFLNVRKINGRSARQIRNTLVHEFCHTPCGYGHGSNSPKGKERSVPYWLGNQAEAWKW